MINWIGTTLNGWKGFCCCNLLYKQIFEQIHYYSVTKLPIIVKGILSAADARIAADLGCNGVFVSNHGGRQLDTAPATVQDDYFNGNIFYFLLNVLIF